MAQAHDDAVVGLGGDLEHVGHRGPVDDERVVAGGLERVGQPGEHAGVVVADQRGLAVHDLGRPHDVAAEHLADALVAEAHAEAPGARPAKCADDLVRQAGVLGAAGPGLMSTPSGSSSTICVEGERVAAVHERLGAELAQVLDEVVDERVVVVDDEDPGAHGAAQGTGPPRRPATGSRRRPARPVASPSADRRGGTATWCD